MKITVILCTYNRCHTLAKALESIAVSKVSEPAEWEVLVVDNNSNDQTREVVQDFCRRYAGRFCYLFEPRQGKSYALNAGIREAQGDVLAFADDDAIVAPDWLWNLTSSLYGGEWLGAGGRIIPVWETELPSWLSTEDPHAVGPLVAFDPGPGAGPLTEAPYGANMAFCREAFEKYGGFRTDLGPRPGSEIRREDTEFGQRLLARGERLRYEPEAVVYHPVPESRVKKSFFLRWYFDYGRAMVREWECGPNILGISRRCFTFFRFIGTYLPVAILRWMVTLNPRRRFFRKCRVWTIAGQTVEIHRQWHNTRKRSNCSTQEQSEAAPNTADSPRDFTLARREGS
jgi:glucosyl-dolichyl phosphate glucuronosyltransferase